MSMNDFDEKIRKALKKDSDDEGSSYFDFDFDNVTFLGKNMALRNKTSSNIFSRKQKRKKPMEDEDDGCVE